MRPVPGALTAESQPTIRVIATTLEGTRAALAAAVPLAKGLAAKLVVIVPRILPYAVELDAACGSTFIVKQYTTVIEQLGGSATVDVWLCRCLDDVVTKAVSTRSTVVLGG